LTKELKALTQKTEKIVKALGKLEKAQAKPKPVKKAAKPKKVVKKPAGKKITKKATKNKAPKGSVTDAIMGVIQASSEGVNTDQIMKQTGLNKRQVWGTINRAKKEGKVKTVKRGIYVGV
jgi:predicted Rossmann fold nucleotide-binding protein DprA/Smf involved in DNA uptake